MRILFTHTYFLQFDQKQKELRKPYAPLATILVAQYMRDNGHDVDLFDTNFVNDPAEIVPKIDSFKPDLLVIYDDNFNYLTKMCLTNMRDAGIWMTDYAHKNGIDVIVSGSDPTDHSELYLKAGAKAVILGEGEETLLEFVQGKNIEDINGLSFLKEGKVSKTLRRSAKKDLDYLPLPAWDLVNFDSYKKAWSIHGYFSINLATTRGCPFLCNWCAKPIYGNKYNSRSPQNVIDEIKLIRGMTSFDHIWFCDDIFGLKPNWVQEFSKILDQENIQIKYKIQSRADLLLKEDTIDALALSGCDEVWIGAESGSQKILDAMDKGTSVEQIYEASKLMQSKGVKPCFFLQLGYLGETWEDLKLTEKMLFDIMPHDIGVSVSYPLPGTKFHDMVADQLEVKSNWTDSDELLLMYKGTFSPEFYKDFHRYLHHKYRHAQLKQRANGLKDKAKMAWHSKQTKKFNKRVESNKV